MDPLTHIIAAVDYSESSESALREAHRLAQAEGAKLSIIHVIDQQLFEDVSPESNITPEQLIGGAQQRLDSTVKDLLGVDARAHRSEVLIGHPFAEIFKATQDWGADLLVLGSRGYGNGKHGRVGAVASRCVRKVPAPVMLVRGSQHAPFRRIAVCIDFSEHSKHAAEYALHVAKADGAAVDFIHISVMSSYIMTGYGSFQVATFPTSFVETHHQLGDAMTEFLSDLDGDAEGIETSINVLDGAHVASCLATFLTEKKSDLAVLGTRGRTGIRSLLLGSTAEALIHDAPCSVLAVKPAGFTYEID